MVQYFDAGSCEFQVLYIRGDCPFYYNLARQRETLIVK